MEDRRGLDGLTLGAFGLVILIGGANFVAVRFSNEELAPFWGAGLRFGAAALIMFAAAAVLRLALPRGRALAGALLYGTLAFGAAYALAYWGLRPGGVPAGLAAVVLGCVPLFTILLASLHGLETLRPRSLGGAALAVGGIAIMATGPLAGATQLWALVALVGTSVAAAESTIIIKRFPPSHPVATNAVAMTVGAVLLVTLSAIAGESRALPTEAATWAAVSYLVVIGSAAMFSLFLFVLSRTTASRTSYQFVLFPVVTILLGAWLADERITAGVIWGAAVVLAGVYLGALSAPKVGAPTPAQPETGACLGEEEVEPDTPVRAD